MHDSHAALAGCLRSETKGDRIGIVGAAGVLRGVPKKGAFRRFGVTGRRQSERRIGPCGGERSIAVGPLAPSRVDQRLPVIGRAGIKWNRAGLPAQWPQQPATRGNERLARGFPDVVDADGRIPLRQPEGPMPSHDGGVGGDRGSCDIADHAQLRGRVGEVHRHNHESLLRIQRRDNLRPVEPPSHRAAVDQHFQYVGVRGNRHAEVVATCVLVQQQRHVPSARLRIDTAIQLQAPDDAAIGRYALRRRRPLRWRLRRRATRRGQGRSEIWPLALGRRRGRAPQGELG